MRQWMIFSKKEAIELWRTKKLLWIGLFFLVMGILNPLTAKLTPMIIENTLGEAVARTMPAPTSLDSWIQFNKNITQIGIYVFALLLSQTIQQERANHQLTPLMVRGFSRSVYIITKWTTLVCCWIISILLTFFVTWGYTAFYFPDHKSPHPLLAVCGILLFGLCFTSILILSSTASRQSFGGMFGVIFLMILLYVIQFFDQIDTYSPLRLLTQSQDVLTGKVSFDVWLKPGVVSIVCVLVCLTGAIQLMKKMKL